MSLGRPTLVTDDQIAQALKATGGLITHAAESLEVSYECLRRRMKGNEELQLAAKNAVENNLDVAESQLMEKIRAGHVISIIFYLKCKGKARGYIERNELTGRDGEPIHIEIKPATGEEPAKGS